MSLAFLAAAPYQLFHYKQIARHFEDVTVVIEIRDSDFSLTEDLVIEHIKHARIEWAATSRLSDLDGRFDAIVCQTPILPLKFLKTTPVVAQQYSMAKELYQYGIWRAHAQLNLMYGQYSVGRVEDFSTAKAVGNPLLDPYFEYDGAIGTRKPVDECRLLYMPTYGELSSLHAVLPYLQQLERPITIKLHHATAREEIAPVAENINFVYSDSDPIELFRSHDVVMSDLSGAAYDALYVGLPLILTGSLGAGTPDHNRLSEAEKSGALTSGVAARWEPGGDLAEAIECAYELGSSPRRTELVDRYFVNPGRAGIECANEISRLINEGEAPSFSTLQVRESTRRYITENRRLKANCKTRSTHSRRRHGTVRHIVRRLYRHTPRRIRRSQLLRLLFRTLNSHYRRRNLSPVSLPADRAVPRRPPREQREEVFRALEVSLNGGRVTFTRESPAIGSPLAFMADRMGAFRRGLQQASIRYSDLHIRVLRNRKTVYSGPVSSLPSSALAEGQWFRVGRQDGVTPPHGLDGYLSVLPVRLDSSRNRYLALDVRADRVDWTHAFADEASQPVDVAIPAGPKLTGPVDVVYTWVDSSDHQWREKHKRYSAQHEQHNPSANNVERYLSRDELRYSMRSLWMFAPFVRHIYLLTMNQRPAWLADHPDVTVVSHEDVFPEGSTLPTFNSHAIESCLHHIDGLSENFLYFNDDVFLGREVTERDFFTIGGLAKVRMAPTQFVYRGRPEPSAIPTDWAAYNASRLLERDLGIDVGRKLMHVPFALNREVLSEIENKYAAEINQTRLSRFRSATDLAVPSMFAQYFAIGTGRATEWSPARNEYLYVDTGRPAAEGRYRQLRTRTPKFFCINVTRYQDVPLSDQARTLGDLFAELYPVPAPWERF